MQPQLWILELVASVAVGGFAAQGTFRPGPSVHGPPPEAQAACAERAPGARCTFRHDARVMVGVCFTPDPKAPVACRPDEHDDLSSAPGQDALPPNRPELAAHHWPRPPRAAVEACRSLQRDASCTFILSDGQLEGRCFSPASALPLACRPDSAPLPEEVR